MIQSLESLRMFLQLDKSRLQEISPGSFVDYNDERKKSSRIELASAEGIISKTKHRTYEKALYEFLALEVWHELLKAYSKDNNLTFRAPRPIGFADSNSENTSLLMEFINGYELKKLCLMRRTTPVKIKGQNYPLPLYPACALHLGALNRIKEEESLFHDDYDTRHILFSPVINVGIGLIDVENTRLEPLDNLVSAESNSIWEQFKAKTSSPADLSVLETWYSQGREEIVRPDSSNRSDAIIERVSKKYNVELDMVNKII
ncbi:MAG: hypothetical protein AABX07_03865, partial [Nanoarchaeota archaeon]